ncbi:hypothetical protein [Polaromonas sp.]|uniref:hypothetical protein n=1 Tax=Polaromonas sp. TaxID=1869339 RepID=UPI00352BB2CF
MKKNIAITGLMLAASLIFTVYLTVFVDPGISPAGMLSQSLPLFLLWAFGVLSSCACIVYLMDATDDKRPLKQLVSKLRAKVKRQV